jgi:hypothetical protein
MIRRGFGFHPVRRRKAASRFNLTRRFIRYYLQKGEGVEYLQTSRFHSNRDFWTGYRQPFGKKPGGISAPGGDSLKSWCHFPICCDKLFEETASNQLHIHGFGLGVLYEHHTKMSVPSIDARVRPESCHAL